MATVAEVETILSADDSDLRRGLRGGDNQVNNFATNTNRRLGMLAANFATFSVGAAIAVGGAALNAAIDWEDSFADVRKTVSDLDAEELADLEESLRNLATNGVTGSLADAHTQLAAIASLGGQLGVSGDDLDEFATTVAAFGVAAESVSTEDAAMFFAQFANLTGLDIATDVDNIADAVVTLGNNMSTNEQTIINFASRLGQLSNVGFEPDEILAWSAAMGSVGLSAELGSTNFALTIDDIQRAARNGTPDLEGFASAAGMTSEEFATLAENDPSEAMDAFIAGLSEMDGSEVQQTLDDLNITGTEQRRVIMALAGGYDTVTTALDLAEEGFSGNGSTMEEAGNKADTLKGKLNLLNNNVHDLAISAGKELAPGFETVVEGLIALTEGDWDASFSKITLGVTDMVESVAEFFGGGGEDGELEWTERLQTGIEVLGDLNAAMLGTGQASLAAEIMWDNAMRNMELGVLRVWMQITGMSSALRQMVLDATGGQVDIMPNLEVDRATMQERIDALEIGNMITDYLREDLADGSIDISEYTVEQEGHLVIGAGTLLEDIDAEAIGIEGRAAIEAALAMAFAEDDEEAMELLLPLATELDLDIEDIEQQAADSVESAVEDQVYDATATVDITLVPGAMNTAAVNAAVAGAMYGNGAGGGASVVVNSYGNSSHELADQVNGAMSDLGSPY